MKDAVEFVLNCLDKMQGKETYIPKIKSAKIIDVARAFGMPYKVIGIRPNEKVHEQLDQDYFSNVNEFLTVDEIRETIKE
jgi:UDP-N-acetylglucosamine 4,6-dehydratase